MAFLSQKVARLFLGVDMTGVCAGLCVPSEQDSDAVLLYFRELLLPPPAQGRGAGAVQESGLEPTSRACGCPWGGLTRKCPLSSMRLVSGLLRARAPVVLNKCTGRGTREGSSVTCFQISFRTYPMS